MEFQCRVIVQRRSALPAVRLWKTFRSKPNAIPVDDKTVRLPTGIGVHLQTGMLFGITTEWCSASHRNRVHLRPDSPLAREVALLRPANSGDRRGNRRRNSSVGLSVSSRPRRV